MPMKSLVARFALGAAAALSVVSLPAAPNPQQPMPATLDLKSAIGFALENNFAIREARERIRQQAGVEIQVRAREIPNVSASGSYTGNSKEISQYIPQTSDAWNISLQARQV